MPEPDYVALERAYKETVIGGKPPDMVACSGYVLNKELKTSRYDTGLMYVVSKDGIEAIEFGDA